MRANPLPSQHPAGSPLQDAAAPPPGQPRWRASTPSPPELLEDVLSQLTSPSDVWSLVLACRPFRAFFRANRRRVLRTAVLNAIPRGALFDATAACDARPLLRLRVWNDHGAPVVREQMAFLDAWHARETAEAPAARRLLQEPGLASALLRLYYVVEPLVAGYKRTARRNDIAPCRPAPHTQRVWAAELSAYERERLWRAFARLEIFRRVFANHVLGVDERAAKFVDSAKARFVLPLQEWECEELLAAEEHLTQVVKGMLLELSDQVEAHAGATHRQLQAAGCPCAATGAPRPSVADTMNLLSPCMRPGGPDWHRWYRCRYLVARGLPYVSLLARLPARPRLRLLLSSRRCQGPSFMVFDHGAKFPWAPPSAPPQASAATDASRGPAAAGREEEWSGGWTWAHGLGLTEWLPVTRRRVELRDAGYAFCDAARLKELGLDSAYQSSDSAPADSPDQWENMFAPNLGLRLRDAGVCWCAVKATAHEFGLDPRGKAGAEVGPTAEVLELEQRAAAAEY